MGHKNAFFLLWVIPFTFLVISAFEHAALAQKKAQETLQKKEAVLAPSPVEKETATQAPEETATQPRQKKQDLQEKFDSLLQKELEGNPAQEVSPAQERPSWAWQFIKTVLVLSILILVFWGLWKVYFFKKNLPLRSSHVLNILYEYDLLTNRKLQIVELGNRLLVLGLSDSGIHLITEISDKDSMDKIKLACLKESSVEKPDFLLELTNAVKNKISDWVVPQKAMSQKTVAEISEDWTQLRKSPQDALKRIKGDKAFFNDLKENV